MALVTNATSTLYGIFASEESWLKGQRALVKREHAQVLANVALQKSGLSQELKNQIAEELYDASMDTVDNLWHYLDTAEDRFQKFRYGVDDSEFEKSVLQKARDLGVTGTRVSNSMPGRKDAEVYHWHLSSGVVPMMVAHVPGFTANLYSYPGSQGHTEVFLGPDESQPHLQVDEAQYAAGPLHPYFRNKDVPKPNPMQVSRILSVNIKQAVRSWDPAAVLSFVRLLKLQVITPDPQADPMEPELYIWQRTFDD